MHPLQKQLQEQITRNSQHAPETDCWIWTGQVSNSGYGRMMLSLQDRVEHESAHRISYLAFVGPLQRGDIVRQRCGNRLCVNPNHLFVEDTIEHQGTHGHPDN